MTWRLAIAAGLMTAALLALVGMRARTLSEGDVATLQIFPPEPASLFRGDEVQLRYSISLLDLDRLPSSGDFEAGDPVYVVLKPDTPYWTADRVSETMPVFRTHHAVIKGTVAYHWRNRTGPPDAKGQLDVTYGIESYVVPGAQAVELTDSSSVGLISVGVAVDNSGRSAIKQILVNGKPRFTEPAF